MICPKCGTKVEIEKFGMFFMVKCPKCRTFHAFYGDLKDYGFE